MCFEPKGDPRHVLEWMNQAFLEVRDFRKLNAPPGSKSFSFKDVELTLRGGSGLDQSTTREGAAQKEQQEEYAQAAGDAALVAAMRSN